MDTLVQSQTPHLQKMADDEDDKKLRRREQNRLSAQRSYHKKQERLQTLRSQVAQLEATYQQHVSSISSSAVPASPSGLLPIPSHSVVSSPATSHSDDQLSSDEKTDRVSPSSPPPPPSHLQDLLSSRTQLQNENDALRRRIDEHTRFQFRLQSLAAGEEAAASDASVQLVHNSITGSPRFQPRIQMKRPLTVEECYTLGSNAYQHMRRHRFPDNYMTTGSSMCGWTDKRVLENGLLKVELRKTFHGHPIDTVARDAWNSVQDPRKMDSLYSLNMNMHSEIVQRIDDNNVVMYQSYETPERDASGNETGAVCVMHHVMLLTSFATETGYIILFMSLEPDRLDDSDHIVDLAEEEEAVARGLVKRRHKQWFKKFSWLTVDRIGSSDDSFECAYLFTVPPHHGASYYWPLEIMLLILRFEVAAVGPVILLPSSGTNLQEEASGLLEAVLSEDDDDGDVVVIENEPVKIEPLDHNRESASSRAVDDDMSDLIIELFP